MPFALVQSDIEVPAVCPALGIPIYPAQGNGNRDHSPSLDRIIPSEGYIPGNVVVISNKANRIKSDASAGELERVASWMRSIGLP